MVFSKRETPNYDLTVSSVFNLLHTTSLCPVLTVCILQWKLVHFSILRVSFVELLQNLFYNCR